MVIKGGVESEFVCNKHRSGLYALYSVHILFIWYQKSQSFAALTRSISDTLPAVRY